MDLIIDTSSENLQVILNTTAGIKASENKNTKHLKHLLPEIEKLLIEQNVKLDNIDNLCVALGPGSFTGVRIGVSTVKAFSCVYPQKRLIGINILQLLANTVIKQLKVSYSFAIIIKSTATKYYFAQSSSTGVLQIQKLLTLEELENYILQNKMPLFSYGVDENFSTKIIATKLVLTPKDYVDYVESKKLKKEFLTQNGLKPIYLALSQAEEELLKKAKNNV